MSVPSLKKLALKKAAEKLTFKEVLALISDLNFPEDILLHLLKVLADKTNAELKHFDEEKDCYVNGEERHLCGIICCNEFKKLSAPVVRLRDEGKISQEQYLYYLFSIDRYYETEKDQPVLVPIRVEVLRQLIKYALDLDEEQEMSQNGWTVSDFCRPYYRSAFYIKCVQFTESLP